MQLSRFSQYNSITGIAFIVVFAVTTALFTSPDSNLEQRVNDLENRVDSLEVAVFKDNITEETDASDASDVSEDKSLSRENWRQLETGMKKDDVRELLGEPRRIAGGSDAVWYYGLGGSIHFGGKKVRSWSEPY